MKCGEVWGGEGWRGWGVFDNNIMSTHSMDLSPWPMLDSRRPKKLRLVAQLTLLSLDVIQWLECCSSDHDDPGSNLSLFIG